MKTETLYVCEHCGRAKNSDMNLMKIHELYCPHNLRALPPETELEDFNTTNDDDYIKYRETVSIDEWIEGGYCIDPYDNELEIYLLNGKQIINCCLTVEIKYIHSV